MEIHVVDLQRRVDDPLDILINGWGRMGIYWGVGKVPAEIQALLYLSARPLCLDEMSERLKTSRSNISLNVRTLQDLGVVRKVIVPGDRKDYYAAETELRTVAKRLAAVKKRRELDPALDVVTRAIRAAESAAGESPDAAGSNGSIDAKRLRELKDLMERIGQVFDTFIDERAVNSGSRDSTKA